MAAVAFFVTAVALGVLAVVAAPAALLFGLFAIAGLSQGFIRPARDMMVHAAAPSGTSGRVFGFVSTGIAVGGTIVPVLFGWIVDRGLPQWIFIAMAGFMIVALITVIVPKRAPDRNGDGQ